MLFRKQKLDWLVVALLALGLFLYCSYQPRFRLRPAMPADFIDEPLAASSQKPARRRKSPAPTGGVWKITFSGNTATVVLCPQIRRLISPPCRHPAWPRRTQPPACVTGTERTRLVSADHMADELRVEFQLDDRLDSKRWRRPAPSVRALGRLTSVRGFATHHDSHWHESRFQRKL